MVKMTRNKCIRGVGYEVGDLYEGPQEKYIVSQGWGEVVVDDVEPEKAQAPDDGGGRVYCQEEDCRKYANLKECPVCVQPTCADHMDAEAEMCEMCVDEASD